MKDILIVDDFQFFRAVDAIVRNNMKGLETSLLPTAERAVKDAKLLDKVDETRTIEGYYHQTKELTRYFLDIRTLQENFTEKITPAIQLLHDVYTHPVFGSLGQGQPTAINPNPKNALSNDAATISPVIDPVTVASFKLQPNWTIEGIMKEVEKTDLGECLVGLAALVDRKNKSEDGSYNPVATCMGCETTVLSRMKVSFRGMGPPLPDVDWRVSKDVEELGRKVIEGYNDLFAKHGPHRDSGKPRLEMKYVTPDNVARILEDAESMIRCVNLNKTELPGKPPQYYHWAIVEKQGKPVVVEFWEDKIIGTKDWQQNPKMRQKYASMAGSKKKNIVSLDDKSYDLGIRLDKIKQIIELPTIPPINIDPDIGYEGKDGYFTGFKRDHIDVMSYETSNGETGTITIYPRTKTVVLKNICSGQKERLELEYEKSLSHWVRGQNKLIRRTAEKAFLQYDAEEEKVQLIGKDGEVIEEQPLHVPDGLVVENSPKTRGRFDYTSFLRVSGEKFQSPIGGLSDKGDYMLVSLEHNALREGNLEYVGLTTHGSTTSGTDFQVLIDRCCKKGE